METILNIIENVNIIKRLATELQIEPRFKIGDYAEVISSTFPHKYPYRVKITEVWRSKPLWYCSYYTIKNEQDTSYIAEYHLQLIDDENGKQCKQTQLKNKIYEAIYLYYTRLYVKEILNIDISEENMNKVLNIISFLKI